MRPLGEIIEDARDGKRPSEEECYRAMLALAFVVDIFHRRKTGVVLIEYARQCDPVEYLGEDAPGNVAYDARRQAALVTMQQVEKVLDDPEILATIRQLGATFPPPVDVPPPPAWWPTGDAVPCPICAYCGSPATERFANKYYCAGCAVEYAVAEQRYNEQREI